jgi:anti-anti-sigma regulatory factor
MRSDETTLAAGQKCPPGPPGGTQADGPGPAAAESAHVVLKADTFSHEHVRAISRWALRPERAAVVVVDLSRADDATTAAFAALVVLRRALLRDGRDLRLSGLRDRPRQLYAVNRLDGVLPE